MLIYQRLQSTESIRVVLGRLPPLLPILLTKLLRRTRRGSCQRPPEITVSASATIGMAFCLLSMPPAPGTWGWNGVVWSVTAAGQDTY